MTWGGSWDILKRAWQGRIGASREVVGTGVFPVNSVLFGPQEGEQFGALGRGCGKAGWLGNGWDADCDVRSCAVGLSRKALTDRGPGVLGRGARWVTSCHPTPPHLPTQGCGSEPRVVPDGQWEDCPWGETAGSPSCRLSWRVEGDGPGCGGRGPLRPGAGGDLHIPVLSGPQLVAPRLPEE